MIDVNAYEQQVVYVKTCPECDRTFNTALSYAVYCGDCNTLAQLLFIHYMVLKERWNIIPPKPNPLVAEVLNVQVRTSPYGNARTLFG